jgi:hypothetical protein
MEPSGEPSGEGEAAASEPAGDADGIDVTAFLATLDQDLGKARTQEQFTRTWERAEPTVEKQLSRSERQLAYAIYDRHEARISPPADDSDDEG